MSSEKNMQMQDINVKMDDNVLKSIDFLYMTYIHYTSMKNFSIA